MISFMKCPSAQRCLMHFLTQEIPNENWRRHFPAVTYDVVRDEHVPSLEKMTHETFCHDNSRRKFVYKFETLRRKLSTPRRSARWDFLQRRNRRVRRWQSCN